MNTQSNPKSTYTIMEAARLSGLPESTLRYYETRGLIRPIGRDTSSKHRVYTEDDIDHIVSIACLSATGLSLEEMHAYLNNAKRGRAAATEQIVLLKSQVGSLLNEERSLKLRQKYLQTKIAYWKAVSDNNERLAKEISKKATLIAKEVKTTRG